MDLLFKIKQVRSFLSYLETSIESSMKKAESHDLPDDSPEFAYYNTLGYVLAAVRDILKELKDYE